MGFLIGASIMILSHGIHVVDPKYHLFFQVSFMFEQLFRGEKIDIYKFTYKGIIVLLVIFGIILDNIYVERVYHNKQEDKTD